MLSDQPTFIYKAARLESEPFLTIVTPQVADRHLLADTARSVRGQSFQGWEWLIVGDASRQEARHAVSESGRVDSRIRFVDSLRTAVSEARSDFILQIEAGDLVEPTAAEKCLWFLISHRADSSVDSFRVSLSDKQPMSAEDSLGVVRRDVFLPNGHRARSERRRHGRSKGFLRKVPIELDDVPFRNELAKTKRRLLMIVPWVTTGGADKFSIDLVSQLSGREWEITVVTTLAGDNSWLPRIAQLTSDVFALPDLVAPTDYPRFARYLIGSRRPDVILISNSLFAYAALPYLRRVAGRTPIVDYCHSVVEGWLDGGYPRLSLERQGCLDLQITSSAALKEWMVERGGDPERIDVCYIGTAQDNGRQHLSRDELGVPEDDVIILYPCRITHEKQPAVFGKTLLELRRRDRRFHALVVGDGPYLDWLRTFARRQGLENSVSFMGYQPNERVRELMSVADCVFLPSKFEGISAVFYEAMAEGVAVVGADVGGQRELVVPECGVLVSTGSEEEEVLWYTEALAELIDDRDRRQKMGVAARARISADFTLDRMGDRMDALLERARALPASTRSSAPAEEEARKAALDAVRIAASTSSAGLFFGPISWRVRHVLFRALSVLGMPVYRLGMRLGARWLEPLKDRVFHALFPGAE
jgi:glycosyltransferase involved in cell wall biosynthesis